jgi:hypothetical protein
MADLDIPPRIGGNCNERPDLVVETMMAMTVMMTMIRKKEEKARKGESWNMAHNRTKTKGINSSFLTNLFPK